MHFNETKGTGVKSNVAVMFSRIFIVDLSQDWILHSLYAITKNNTIPKNRVELFHMVSVIRMGMVLVGVKCPTLHSNADVSKNLLE